MEPIGPPRVKVCCIADEVEAWLAIRYGAAALGLVSAMPSGPGVIGEEQIAHLARAAPPGVATFLLTSATDPDTIIAQQRRLGPSTLQLVDRLEPGAHAALRAALPGIRLVQVMHVTDETAVDEALRVAPAVDALLLDTGNPALAVKVLGGTGRTHDWGISREIRRRAPVPVYLAGGLTPANVAEAVATVGPFGVDLCNGVRTDGALDEAKLAAFMVAVRSSDSAAAP